MYDMTKLRTRYFTMKLKNGKILDLEPPKIKVLKKIAALSEVENNNNLTEKDINNLSEAVALALNKNKQNYKISVDRVTEEFDIEEIVDFLNNYFTWVGKIQNSKN